MWLIGEARIKPDQATAIDTIQECSQRINRSSLRSLSRCMISNALSVKRYNEDLGIILSQMLGAYVAKMTILVHQMSTSRQWLKALAIRIRN